MTNVSIVIPTFRRANLALNLVRQIQQFNPDVEIVVVNQKGNVQDEIAFKKLKINYINLRSANTATAKNIGWKRSKGEIIVFFDDDVEITEKTIEAHVKTYLNKDITGVGGRVINDGDIIPKENKVETGITNQLFSRFLFKFWSQKPQTIDFVYGCNMSFRRDVLEKLNGFDNDFKLAFEEIDLSIRIKKMGGVIQFVPEALAYHHKHKSGGTRSSKKITTKQINYFYYGKFVKKHLNFFKLTLIALVRSITIIIKEKDIKLLKWWWGGLCQNKSRQL